MRVHRRKPAGAFTLVEMLMTITLMGVGLTASMRVLPILIKASEIGQESQVALRLASDLMAEMATLPYQDPDGSATFGTETGEGTSTRTNFDDIDDYDDWTGSPPEQKDGTEDAGGTGYARTVAVVCVDADDFTQVEADGDTLPKRITITVTRAGMPDVTLVTVRLPGANREDLY